MNNRPAFQLSLIDKYPDFSAQDFNEQEYSNKFQEANVILMARVKGIHYKEHCPCLSIKCAFNGYETYQGMNSFYAINDDFYLLFNQGTLYSNAIENEVESFTVNFSNAFIEMFTQLYQSSIEKWMDDPWNLPNLQIRFTEKLYCHGGRITELILRLRVLSGDWLNNRYAIEEIYYDLLEVQSKKKIKDTAVVRLEQLFPFPETSIKAIFKKYKGSKIVWVQEEPANMGPLSFIQRMMPKQEMEFISRKVSASPATGYSKVHKAEQEKIVTHAFEI